MTIVERLSEATFRASARFELKRLDQLTPAQRQPFDELTREAGFYGLLIPRPSSPATVKSIGGEIAALLHALSVPSPLGATTLDRDDVVDLVLDGVLEIEHEGDFISGADAMPLVCGESAAATSGLSLEALRYAQDLEVTGAGPLTSALYLYNRLPMTRFWTARFPNHEAVLSHLGANELNSHWQLMPPAQANGWIAFHARDRRVYQAGAAVYKLYVSPRPENIRDAFQAVVRTLAGRDVDFKIGPDAAGLLRPDKMVAYFGRREELEEIAHSLQARLAGCAAHGVPFTAVIDGDGLLSWGVDPPDSARALSWLGRESWRLWLATKLGAALAFAKSESSRGTTEPWRFAVERVRRLGVDVERWTPTDVLWSAT